MLFLDTYAPDTLYIQDVSFNPKNMEDAEKTFIIKVLLL